MSTLNRQSPGLVMGPRNDLNATVRDNARWLGLTHRIFGLAIWHDETFAAPRLDVGAAIRAATDRVAAVAPWLQPRGADGFTLAGRVGYGENLLHGWAPLIERWLIAWGDVDDDKSEAATLSDLDGDDAEAIAESYGGLFVRLAEWGVSSFDLAMPLFGADPLVNEPNLIARSRAAGIEPADLLVVTAIETLVLGSLFAEDELVALLEATMLEYHLNQRVDVTSLIRDGWSIEGASAARQSVATATENASVLCGFVRYLLRIRPLFVADSSVREAGGLDRRTVGSLVGLVNGSRGNGESTRRPIRWRCRQTRPTPRRGGARGARPRC